VRGWLLDTNVVSELRKTNCHVEVQAWADAQLAEDFYLSTITIAEIRYGIERQADADFRRELTAWLERSLRSWFGDRILPVDEDVILEWRRMVDEGRVQGIVFSQPDLFIAATARLHDLCVATRNVADFEPAGVAVFNPWTDHWE